MTVSAEGFFCFGAGAVEEMALIVSWEVVRMGIRILALASVLAFCVALVASAEPLHNILKKRNAL
jgi:hypothetical protein